MSTTSAAAFAEPLRRIPKFVLFGAAALIQLALLAVMVADRVEILREGTEVKLQIQPVDPHDLFRGDYVTLSYDISRVPAGALKDQRAGGRNPIVYVELAPNQDGIYHAVSLHTDAVAVQSPQVLIRGRVVSGTYCGATQDRFCDSLNIRYGLESYFVPEGEGRTIERDRNQHKLMVVAAVAPSGRAAIKRLLVDGEAAYEEPLF